MADLTNTPSQAVIDQTERFTLDQSKFSGEAIDAGENVYLSSADDKVYLADNDDTEAKAELYGRAANSAPAADMPIAVLRKGIMGCDTVEVGTRYIQSNTPGGTAPDEDLITGEYVSTVGEGWTTSKMTHDFTARNNSTGKTHA